MKRLIISATILVFSLPLFSQSFGINTTGATANASAMLDIDVSGLAAKKGLLIPRVTAAEKTAMNPLPAAAQGLTLYQTDGVQGFYYNSSTTTTPAWAYVASSTSAWATLGNAGTTAGTNFIGTTDAIDLVVKTNATERMRILSTGNTGIRTTTPFGYLSIAHSQADGNANQTHGIYFQNSLAGGFGHAAIFSQGSAGYNGSLIFSTDGDGIQNYNATEKMRLTFDGKLGIGTTTPGATLEVAGQVKITGGSPGTNKVLTSDAVGLGNWVDPNSFAWKLTGNSGTSAGTNFLGTTDNQNLVFKLNNTEYLRFEQPGRIVLSNFNDNIAIGYNTLSNTTGIVNTAIGTEALNNNSSGNDNYALGFYALHNNTTGSNNVAIGTYSMESIQTENNNTAIGKNSGYQFTGGSNNCFMGSITGAFSTGGNNTYLGKGSGTSASGSGNVFLGYNVGQFVSASNRLFIDNSVTTTPLIYGEFDNDIVGIGGKLGVATNSPLSTLQVNGTFATTVKTAQVAGTNDPDNTAAVWFYSSGAGTITLPAANTCSSRRYLIINQTGASVTTSAYFNLAAASVTALANSASIEIISDGTDWRQIK